jgi:hypothetical protein
VGTVNDEVTNTLSDHLPTWIVFDLMAPFHIPPPWDPQPTLTNPDLDMTDKPSIEEYNTHLTKRITAELPKKFRSYTEDKAPQISPHRSSCGLAAILRHSVLSVHDKKDGLGKEIKIKIALKCQRLRSDFKDGYSRGMRQLQVYLYFYRNIIRKVYPPRNSKKRTIWSQVTYQALLTKWHKEWSHKYTNTINKITPLSPAAALPLPTHLSQKSYHSISLAYLQTQITRIKTSLHGTRREEMRESTNPVIKKRAALHKAKKLGQLIQQLSGRSQGQLDLQSLPSSEYGQLTDPIEIKDTLNDFFQDWHAIPKGLDPAAHQLAHHPTFWQSLLRYQDTGTPQVLNKASNIPPALQDGLRRACSVKVSPAVEQYVHEVVNQEVDFSEFNQAINNIPNGGAAGPSKASNNMIKAWNESTRRLVFEHMQNIWTTRSTPKWFKDKLIKLAPKIHGNTELKNMRPISLYEVLRKIWTTIIGKRIHLAWHVNDVLHPRQYGYRLDQGTHMALFTVLNQIEHANHAKETKNVTFWDIKRAFDSIPRNIQKLSWIRLGVPMDVAEWFVNLDDGGLSFISSPYYNLHKALKTPTKMKGHNTHFTDAPHLGYKAQRGIGQGESASSLMWTALYDILMEWIDPSNRGLHAAETDLDYTHQDARDTCPSAYADDLCTITAGHKAELMQQHIATWISAFCAFTGMVMHPAKIFSTIIGPIPAKYKQLPIIGPLGFDDKTDLVIHDLNWTPISCPKFPYLKTMKYLGVHLALRDETHSDSHQAVLLEINTHITHLLVQPGPVEAKISDLLFKLIPIVMNTALCANWTLKLYRELDIPFSRAYKILLGFPKTFPDALLYIPTSSMGVGLPRFSDKAQVMKWQAMLRCLAVRGDPAQSMDAFLDRLPPAATSTADYLRTLSSPARWPNQKKYTARSIIEWFAESKLSPCVRTEQSSANSQSIKDIAEHQRLWPSDWYDDEDNSNLPPLRLVATDGSFTIVPEGAKDILLAEADLRCTGQGAAGIVFIPPDYSEDTSPPPLGVQIISTTPEPGMNAFTWELTAQVIALHLTKHQSRHLILTSDCISAISVVNKALRQRNDTQASVRGGLMATAAHEFADPAYPRRMFRHTKAHPERDDHRRNNPNIKDKAIYMADAVAGHTKAAMGGKQYPINRHVLRLDNVFDEIIPAGQWHIRTQNTAPFPVMGDLLPFQHKVQIHNYCQRRDISNNEHKWSSTALSLAHKLHPLPNRSYWTAGRRTLVAFDWLGHGRNRAKPTTLSQDQKQQEAKCHLCGQLDSQQHCMLDCTHSSFTTIRHSAQQAQADIALNMLNTMHSDHTTHFIQQLVQASWTPSHHTSRIWLGLWNTQTLGMLLKQSLDSPISMQARQTYIKMAKQLTAPLIEAYTAMQVVIIANPRRDNPDQASLHPSAQPLSLTSSLRLILENTHLQYAPDNAPCLLNSIDTVTHTSPYTLSDAAFGLPDAAEDT